jgi:aminoglycoside/choline kinase family phosphotransferase
MTPRDAEIAAFLAAAGWGAPVLRPLAGDASSRRYHRVTDGPAKAVLMDAAGTDLRPFLAVGGHLRRLGLSAPEVIAADEALGLMLLEDLGDDLFARLVSQQRVDEATLYAAAVDLLAELSRVPPPDIVTPFEPDLVSATAPAFDWYARDTAGAAARGEFDAAFGEALAASPDTGRGLILRDFHAENLIWLPSRRGVARVGLLDFQDARSAPPVYDLVSLLEDARRDVGDATDRAMRARFAAATGRDRDELDHAAAVLALQRNLRILGIFARLSLHFGKPGYVDLIPRVWRHVLRDLAHPSLTAVADIVTRALPEPSPPVLARLKSLCGTVPTP